MSDLDNSAISALIASNQAISDSVKANSKTVEATNEVVKELTNCVQELVTTERERVLKDQFQKEVNAKQEIYNTGNDALWKEAHDTIVRAKRFHATFDKISVSVIGLLVVGVLTLLGFSFS